MQSGSRLGSTRLKNRKKSKCSHVISRWSLHGFTKAFLRFFCPRVTKANHALAWHYKYLKGSATRDLQSCAMAMLLRGRTLMSKVGDPNVRNHLFMCSFTACEHNPQCKALYERLVAKGKSKKLALIAVCNKLIKQALAIAQSGTLYDPHYAPIKVLSMKC